VTDQPPGQPGKHARYDAEPEESFLGGFAPEPPEPPTPRTPAGEEEPADFDDVELPESEYDVEQEEYAHDWEELRPRSPWRSLVAAAIVLIVVAAVVVGGVKGYSFVKDHLHHSAADYSGTEAHGRVVFEVHQGDTATDIGRALKDDGVVESVDAFIDAAKDNSKSSGIQVGSYLLQQQMKASDALGVLVDPKNLVQSLVTVPEGARVAQIIGLITQHTDISKKDVVAALAKPGSLGLPSDADGNPEGYLFPATYTVVPGETATTLLRQMVAKATSEYQQLGVAAGAARLGLSSRQLITVASILEYEAKRAEDYPKVARAIYNRLDQNMPLQSDATVSYANGVSGEIWTTPAQRANGSPYNTYNHTGLPPGPIGSPGETTIQAALHPATGSWLYWVVVNLKTGETVFSTTLADHDKAVAQFHQYCQTSDAC
jgi:UPF0755 protein